MATDVKSASFLRIALRWASSARPPSKGQKSIVLHKSRNSRVLSCAGLAFVGVILACVLLTDVQAEDKKPSPFAYQFEPIPRVAEKMTVRRLLSEVLRVRFNGYSQVSYTQNFNRPSNDINELRIFDVNSNQFRANVIQAAIERQVKLGGSALDRLGFRVKFNAGQDSDFIGGLNLNPFATFQEFYVNYIAPLGRGLDLQVGQFNALVGYEQVGNPYSPNYSRSYLYLGQPFTMGGISATYEFNEQVMLSVRAISYVNAAQANSHHEPLVETLLMVFPSERMRLMLYGLAGPRAGAPGTPGGTIVGGQRAGAPGTPEGMLLLAGGYASWQIGAQTWAVVEAYYANQSNSSLVSPGKSARWDGVAAYLFHDFTKEWGVRLRGEIFEDKGGLVTCQGTTAYQPKANVCFGATSTEAAPAVAQTLWEVTATLEYRPFPSLKTRLEYRYDKSDHNVFQVGGRATSYQPTLSLDVVYIF
jgi:hypothetical protein